MNKASDFIKEMKIKNQQHEVILSLSVVVKCVCVHMYVCVFVCVCVSVSSTACDGIIVCVKRELHNGGCGFLFWLMIQLGDWNFLCDNNSDK